jgi:hypothetical protein
MWRMTHLSEWPIVGGIRVGNCNILDIIFLVSLPPKAFCLLLLPSLIGVLTQVLTEEEKKKSNIMCQKGN